ncbi:MAG TPA: tetratricopeptide repeat protein [Desulfohalobiaceae bacterium]|nr:tetratricopeptide repeat protein [Desulfohalobiaceae bacterium]
MFRTIKSRQYTVYFVVLFLCACSSFFGYHYFESEFVYFRKVENALTSGNNTLALKYFNQAQQAVLHSRRLGLQLGNLFLANNQFKKAEKIFQSLLISRPKNISIRYKLALVMNINGRHNQALKLVNQLLKVKPGSHQVLFLKAKILTSLGDFDQAILIYREILGESV